MNLGRQWFNYKIKVLTVVLHTNFLAEKNLPYLSKCCRKWPSKRACSWLRRDVAEGLGSGRVCQLQMGRQEEGVVWNGGREAGAIECVCNELRKGDCGLCRFSVDRYCNKKLLVSVSNDKWIEGSTYRVD